VKRGLLLALAGCFVILLLTSCGGGGGAGGTTGPQPPPVITGETQGKVDAASIGVQNPTDLQVQSVWDDQPAPVNQNGEFTTKVSQTGTQLLLITDKENKLRGLTISLPSKSGKRAEVIPVTPKQVAQILVFITPGILTLEPDEARNRLSDIENLSSFPALQKFIEDILRQQHPLTDLITDPQLSSQLENYLTACVSEYFQKHPLGTTDVSGEIRSDRAIQPGENTYCRFWTQVVDSSHLNRTRINLYNSTWRFMIVYRLKTDASGNKSVDIPSSEILPGIKPVSLGLLFQIVADLFSGPGGSAIGKLEDYVDFTNITKVEYWGLGAGNPLKSKPAVPPEITSRTDYKYYLIYIWAYNVSTYIILPFCDFLTGVNISNYVSHENINALFKAVIAASQSAPVFSDWTYFIEDLSQGKIDLSKGKEIAGRILDLTHKTFSMLMKVEGFRDLMLNRLGPDAFAKLSSSLDLFLNRPLRIANLIAVFTTWSVTPTVAKASVVKTKLMGGEAK
jgi:hypothetical protein